MSDSTKKIDLTAGDLGGEAADVYAGVGPEGFTKDMVEQGKTVWDLSQKSDQAVETWNTIKVDQEQYRTDHDDVSSVLHSFITMNSTISNFIDIIPFEYAADSLKYTVGAITNGISAKFQHALDAYNQWKNGGGGSGGGSSGGSGNSDPNSGNDYGQYPPPNPPQPKDPLIIDLDGDGVTLSAPSSTGSLFDIDNDGFREQVGWVAGHDGFLVRDLNDNGQVDDASELFGDSSQTGHQQLATFDTNADGKIDSADAVWSDLKVWADADHDGLTDAGELLSLNSLGISSLSLAVTTSPQTQEGGELISTADVTFADGRHTRSFSANLLVNQTITEQVNSDFYLG